MTTLESNWYGTAVRKLHLDYHVPEWMCRVAETITVEGARQQARMFREAGVEAVEFFAYDHHGFCLFSSQHGINHPGLAQDYTGNMRASAPLATSMSSAASGSAKDIPTGWCDCQMGRGPV